jgi:putative oxidoreductase
MQTDNYLLIAARVLVPSVFIALGVERLLIYSGLVPGPQFSAGAIAFSVFELVLGALIVLGWKLRFTAGLMAIFIVIDAFASHPFWTVSTAEAHDQYLHFAKNLSTLGGLVLLVWADLTQAKNE